MSKTSRRAFVSAAAGGGGALLLSRDPALAARRARRLAVSRAGEVGFGQGVASGQPAPRGITLWTLAEGIEESSRLELEVARDAGFGNVVARRDVIARRGRNYTVHARLDGDGLSPGEGYYYRFTSRGSESPVGRFKTALPADSGEPVRIGFFSCQNYESGFYTAHAGLAEEEDLDLVVCLGDYIYERRFDSQPVREDHTGENGQGEVERLGGYRGKYALYHSDPNLRRLRQRHSLISIWDDHEVEDNYARNKPGDATQDRDIPFLERRRNAYQAFFEHMPRIRHGNERDRIYGTIPLGRHAELFLLDERQYRDDQPCGDQFGSAECPEASEPGRTMLGRAQRRWLKGRLRSSNATWKVVGTQVMIMALDTPARNAINPDQWDGYKAERKRLLQFLRREGIEDVTFVTGDIHTFFAGDVTPSGRLVPSGSNPSTGERVATEFVGGSMTSKGIADSLSRDEDAQELAATLGDSSVRANNPHIVYSEQDRKGYGVLEASSDELRVTYRGPQTTQQPNSLVSTIKRFRVERGRPEVEVLGPPLP